MVCSVPFKPDQFSNWTKFKMGFNKKLVIVLLKDDAIPNMHRSPKLSL